MKIINFLLSRVRIAWWKLRGWKMLVEGDIFDLRMADCDNCPHHDREKDECRLCGCPIIAKTLLASEHCPVGKWKRQKHSRKTT